VAESRKNYIFPESIILVFQPTIRRKISPPTLQSQKKPSTELVDAGRQTASFLLSIFFDPEDGYISPKRLAVSEQKGLTTQHAGLTMNI
jgi:hypothetical protein